MNYIYTLFVIVYISVGQIAYADFTCNKHEGYNKIKKCEITNSNNVLCVLDNIEENQLSIGIIEGNSFGIYENYDANEYEILSDSIYASKLKQGTLSSYKSKLEINSDGSGIFHDYFRDIGCILGGDCNYKNEVLTLTNCE